MREDNVMENLQKYFLLSMLVLLIIIFFRFLSPFLATLFIAGTIVSAINPLKNKIQKKFKISTGWASGITFTLVLILSIIVIAFFFVSVVSQASNAYLVVNTRIEEFIGQNQDSTTFFENYPFLQKWMDTFREYNPISLENIISTAGDFVGSFSSFLLDQTKNIIKQLSLFLLHFLVFIFAVFYFLRDGKQTLGYVQKLIPLPTIYKVELFKKMHTLMHSILVGIFGAALAQGCFVALGFVLTGINNAAFWGLLAAMFSPIPYLGTTIIWMPAVVSLYLSGHYFAGSFLLIWGLIIVGLVDNLIKPYLIGSGATLHPFAVLLVILGGVFTFGFQGLIFGPFILTLTLAFLHIYQLEYYSVLKK